MSQADLVQTALLGSCLVLFCFFMLNLYSLEKAFKSLQFKTIEKYYNQDSPEISDYEYDQLMNELIKLLHIYTFNKLPLFFLIVFVQRNNTSEVYLSH